MNELFRFMSLRSPDTSDVSSFIDPSNPRGGFQNAIVTAITTSATNPSFLL